MADPASFIKEHRNIAINESIRSGMPASVIMAQAILESGWGKSGLTVNANNYFGIKADSSWKGPTYSGKTHEVYGGETVYLTDAFRAYNSPRQSFKDHSDFLMKFDRYNSLWNYPMDDYVNWSVGLKNAGYATSPTYDSKLIGLIEKYNLQSLDKSAKERKLVYNVLKGIGVLVGAYLIYKVVQRL